MNVTKFCKTLFASIHWNNAFSYFKIKKLSGGCFFSNVSIKMTIFWISKIFGKVHLSITSKFFFLLICMRLQRISLLLLNLKRSFLNTNQKAIAVSHTNIFAFFASLYHNSKDNNFYTYKVWLFFKCVCLNDYCDGFRCCCNHTIISVKTRKKSIFKQSNIALNETYGTESFFE